MPTPAEVATEAFWDLKKRRIRVSPSHTTRASSLGYECERYLFYEQTAGEKKAPHSPELQAIFDLGNMMEDYVLRELQEAGIQVYQRGRDHFDRRLNLTGHVDAKLRLPGVDRAIPAEIKGLNPYTAETIEKVQDIKGHRSAWVRKYYAQLQTYLYLEGEELGLFVLANKSTGQFRFLDCPLDFEYAEALLKKAERVRDAVAGNAPPPQHVTDECPSCPFVHVCTPALTYGPGVRVLDSEEVASMLARREELAKAADEYEKLDKAIKKALPHSEEMLCGDFAIKGAEVQRKGYTVEPGNYWKYTIKRINQEKNNAAK